ncbi:exocyst complex component SEC8-like isoform X1 [Zingiber officinale]|uniref:exocyst complex component SEC8-like isoform X1 n=1 Tax=Zingiber officinale TaxID=94328 RepID=UPI001C4C3F48|nr:exocyst complex component SEC8-like isoform X1 [Zingiber officinale]
MSSGRAQGIFDGLPIPADKAYLKEGLSRIDESWAASRFDSLPHVVHILTSKDREGEVQFLKEQSDLVEDVVDEVVHVYHHGFNKAIQNYSQILRLFSESAESISILKVDMANAKKFLGSRNKQLHQLWYRSLTLRHVLTLLDQIESVSKVPARIEKLIADKQFYAAVQLQVQSMLVLEREGLQVVGALQDIRSELAKLRGVLFYKVLEDLHSHLYNKGEFSSASLRISEMEDQVLNATAIDNSVNSAQPLSRRTRLVKIENHFGGSLSADGSYRPGSIDDVSSFEGHDDDSVEIAENAVSDGAFPSARVHADGNIKKVSRQMPTWLSSAMPDEFLESMKKSDAPLYVKYSRTLVECLCMLGKVAAAGAVLCQRLRPTIHEIIISKVKVLAVQKSSRSGLDLVTKKDNSDIYDSSGILDGFQVLKPKSKNNSSFSATQLVVSPVSPIMTPKGAAQSAAGEFLNSILDYIICILENHIIVGELLESKLSQQADNVLTPKAASSDTVWGADSESSQTGGFNVGFSLTVIQSECQQLICEILRATPEAATSDAAVQTSRLGKKNPAKEKRDGSEGLSFAFRFTDAAASMPKREASQGWQRGTSAQQEGYGTSAVLPDQGIYLAASVYRPVVQFSDKVASMLHQKYSQLVNDGLLAFIEKFLKDHFLPAMFVDYRKSIQQAISSPAAFRPRANGSVYKPLVENGRPVLQGLLASNMLAKEVLGWAHLMPKYANELVEFVQTFLERTYERCRTSYTEAVLEKQSYMLIGRSDVEGLMRVHPSNAYLRKSHDQSPNSFPDAETVEVELEISELLLGLRPIKQEHLIRDDHKLILLASLSDSLEYLADSVESVGDIFGTSFSKIADKNLNNQAHRHTRSTSAVPPSFTSLAEEYRRLAIDCLKVLRLEMQLETIFHLQEMTNREYLEDQDAEEPDDFIISLATQIMRRDEELAPFVSELKRNYIFGGISSIAANASIKALAEIRSINLLGVQQICRNSIALEQALAAIPSINSEAVQQRLDRVRTYYELLNLPFEALLAFIQEHEYLFTQKEYSSLLKVNVPGREIPADADKRISGISSH